jgi:hypothetical protein
MSYASFAGIPITSLSWAIPLVGLWTADVQCSLPVPLPAVGPMTIGNLTMQGSVYRQATFGGVTSARLVAGFGGWSKRVGPRGYSLPFGIPLTTVLGDVAIEVQEPPPVVVVPTFVGNFWARPADSSGTAPAGRVLRAAAGPTWYASPSGVVQVGPRLPQPIVTPFQATDWDGASGTLTIATEDPASWVPGAVFASPQITNPQTVAFARHFVDHAGVGRLRVMVSP